MFWEKLAGFFTLEAVATYLVALVTVAFWLYRGWKSKQGRHVVCSQPDPAFSHLQLSKTAREWVKISYADDSQPGPVEIHTLSQVFIDIANDSDTDTLHNVKLRFRVPDARLLRVWWEIAPDYLLEDSGLEFSLEDASAEESHDRPWIIQVSLPNLKSFKKYKEKFLLGILADGNLRTIEMLPEGSRGQAPPDQAWTARFFTFRELQQKATSRVGLAALGWQLVAGAFVAMLLVGAFLLYKRQSAYLISSNWHSFVAFFVLGFLFSGLFAFALNQLRDARIRRTLEEVYVRGVPLNRE